MKKVTELKANECIHCRTKEEYDAIIDLLDKEGRRLCSGKPAKNFNAWKKQVEGLCIFIDDKGIITYDTFRLVKTQNYTIHPASEFLEQFKWGEDVEVSDSGEVWYEMKFVGMNPVDGCSFVVTNENGGCANWALCRKPQTERANIEAQIKELQEKLKSL